MGSRPKAGYDGLVGCGLGINTMRRGLRDRLGFLDMQGFRAARVIVDIGVHLGLTIPADNPYRWRPGEVWGAMSGLDKLLVVRTR